jgi:small basic protein (TIGR04137 family)
LILAQEDCGTFRLRWRAVFDTMGEHFFEKEKEIMSQHRSLRGSSKITSKRNVLKRFERVNLLQKRGEWKEDSRGLGLKKTKPEA